MAGRRAIAEIQFQQSDPDNVRIEKLRRLAQDVATLARERTDATAATTVADPTFPDITGPGLLGRLSGTGQPSTLTGAQAETLLPVFTTGNAGLAPAPTTASVTLFLNAAGGWSTPSDPGSIAHGALAGLANDDHPQYPQIATAETISGDWLHTGQLAVSGRFLIGDGSESAPGMSFIADPDTGIFRIGINTMALVTGAVERLRITADGAWGLSGVDYGLVGQPLLSAGSSAPPEWGDTFKYMFTLDAETHYVASDFARGHNVIGVRFAGTAEVYLPADLESGILVSVKDEAGTGDITVFVE